MAAPAAFMSPSRRMAYEAPERAAAGLAADETLLRSGKPHASSSLVTAASAPDSCSAIGWSRPSISPAAMRNSVAAPTADPAPATATVTGGLVGADSSIDHVQDRSSAFTFSKVALKVGSE